MDESSPKLDSEVRSVKKRRRANTKAYNNVPDELSFAGPILVNVERNSELL